MKILITYLVVIVVAVGLGFLLFRSSKKDPSTLPGVAYASQGQNHIPEGSTDHEPYNSNPPTSGPHWPEPARCLVYTTTQPDERLVHNLEHGGIWISYKTSVDPDTVAKLNDFATRYGNVLVEPRDADDSNIALAAWGRLLTLDHYDEGQIQGFIHAFMDKGPERLSCAH
jgi:hypothetical protein